MNNKKFQDLSLNLINGNLSDYAAGIKKLRKKDLTQYLIYCYNILNESDFIHNLVKIDNILHN